MFTNSLYYPSILIPNDIWLRKSILYWDSINPIAPRIVSDDIPEKSVSKLLEREELLKFIHPEELLEWQTGRSLSTEFSELIKSEQIQRILPRRESRNFQLRIHRHKFSDTLLDEIRGEHLFKENSKDYDWLLFEMNAGLIYMGFLATELSKKLGMEPITDKNQFSDLFLLSQYQPSAQKSQLLTLALEELLPAPKENIDIKKVIRFRKQNEADLLRFRTTIRTIVEELNTFESNEDVSQKIESFKDQIKEECLTIDRKLKENKIDTIFTSLDAFVDIDNPKILGALGLSVINTEIALAALGVNAVIKVGSKIFDGIKRRNNVFASSPYSYVYKIERNLI